MIGLVVITAINSVYASPVFTALAVRMKKLARLAAKSFRSAHLKMNAVDAQQMFRFAHISPLLINFRFNFGYFS